ncbi:Uu.00g016980.m01.CDS01 [Anthostomella pinea]|uniref:Uu.00g016980.m01.CDS01 n=1 Tax=Anthostomella pinea TaxID=933095 RepID=A0AAI8YQF9_9PEZI|nr:Uu.00g016980.m01.CDS01 [Anthostomella pinea]
MAAVCAAGAGVPGTRGQAGGPKGGGGGGPPGFFSSLGDVLANHHISNFLYGSIPARRQSAPIHHRKKRHGYTRPMSRDYRDAPEQDASPEEVHAWMLKVFARRSHPHPEQALEDTNWSGRDLHRSTYLATRRRFQLEPDGYTIAHDLCDALRV